jgi:hypothetical protein
MKVKNINARRQNSCKCGSWLDHWVNVSGHPLPQYCSEPRCMGKPELGAHVQKDSSTDTNWYIIPLCVKHSIRAEFLDIVDTTIFVSAHVDDTCEKQAPLGHAWPGELREIMPANTLRQGVNIVQAQDWRDHGDTATFRLHGKRKEKQDKSPPLRATY